MSDHPHIGLDNSGVWYIVSDSTKKGGVAGISERDYINHGKSNFIIQKGSFAEIEAEINRRAEEFYSKVRATRRPEEDNFDMEVAYRVYDPATDTMHYDVLIQYMTRLIDGKYKTEVGAFPVLSIDSEGFPVTGDSIAGNIMEFAHMHDMEMKRIFQGDITEIELENGEKIRFVCQLRPTMRHLETTQPVSIVGFCFVNVEDGAELFPLVENFAYKHDLQSMRVIGNTFQNPELLQP